RIVAGEADRVADLARHEPVCWRCRSWVLRIGEVGDLIFRFESIERIVPDQAGDLRLQVAARQPLPERGLARLLHLTQPAVQLGDLFRLPGERAFLLWRRQEQARR